MKKVSVATTAIQRRETLDMANYILTIIRGNVRPMVMSERNRQYYTWAARELRGIASECGCRGLQMRVSGLKFKGLVRIWYNPSSDYFDVELIRGNSVKFECEDLDFEQLHNVLHKHIEREDDPEV